MQANTNTIVNRLGQSVTIASIATGAAPYNPTDEQAVADWYNLATAYLCWATAVQIGVLRAATDLSKYTPADAAPASSGNTQGTNDALLYQNRALQCQLKQANAMFALQGTGAVDASSNNLRQIFSDCMTQIPSGVGGANQNAGWGTAPVAGAVRLAMMRTISNVEKVFVTAASGAGNDGVGGNRGTSTNPDLLGPQGALTQSDVDDVLLNG